MSKGRRRGKIVKTRRQVSHLEQINHHAAGIDVGAESHYVAVPPESAAESVREFGVFTGDLHALADWRTMPGDDGSDGIDWRLLDPIV